MFKDNRSREDAPMYKIINDRPINANEGLHKVDYKSVDKNLTIPDLSFRERQPVK